MPMNDTRRRVAELLGITVEYVEYPPIVNLLSGWYVRGLTGANPAGGFSTEEAAWASLPDWPTDPAAALALLAGTDWQATRENECIHMSIATLDPGDDYWPPHWNNYVGSAKIEHNDEAAAFAAAATAAWVSWRESEGEG